MTDSSPPDATPVDAGDTGVKARALTRLQALRQALLKVLPQQDAAVDSLLAGGHLLLEGPTGSGKTLLTRALAASLDAGFARLHCHPALTPAEVAGEIVTDLGSDSARLRRGPLFNSLVLLEDLHRAPPVVLQLLDDALQGRQPLGRGPQRRRCAVIGQAVPRRKGQRLQLRREIMGRIDDVPALLFRPRENAHA